MTQKISKPQAKKELGVSGKNIYTGEIRADEFLRELKGKRGIAKYREMRDNDPTVGAIMYAVEQVLRDVPRKIKPADDSENAIKMADFVEGVLEDMDHTLDDHISQAVSYISYGFATFEVVYKRRGGTDNSNPKKYSKFNDGLIGVKKIAPRAQWTIERFDVDKKTSEFKGVWQEVTYGGGGNYIPASKLLHYCSVTQNGDPSGRSALRNAYSAYTYLTKIQMIEAIAIERELHGVPVGRISAEYLSPNATDEQKAVRRDLESILRDLKMNEQGYAVLPSDVYVDQDGNPTNQRLVDIELITSNGNRNIDMDPVIKRYQHDIARSVMAEFLMLGGGNTGSYALSKSKTDLFLRALESYINIIFDVLNKQLLERLWKLNGFNFDLMPKIIPGDIAPHDLKELGAYLRNLNGADISLADQTHIVDALLDNAELPNLDTDVYAESRERARVTEDARNDYYDGPDDNVIGSKNRTSEDDDNVVDSPQNNQNTGEQDA